MNRRDHGGVPLQRPLAECQEPVPQDAELRLQGGRVKDSLSQRGGRCVPQSIERQLQTVKFT